MATKSSFGRKLEKILDKNDISQSELERRTGISQSTISDWIKKDIEPGWEKVQAVCKALGLPCTAFSDGDAESKGLVAPKKRPPKC